MTASTPPCDVLLEQLSAYLDGDLSEAQCQVIAQHARRCSRCRTVIADLRRTSGLCRDLGERPLPKAVRERAREQIEQLLATRRSRGT